TTGPNILADIIAADQEKAHEQEVESLARRRDDLKGRIAAYEQLVLSRLTDDERAQLEKPKNRQDILGPKILAATNADEYRRYKDLRQQLKDLEDRKAAVPQALCVKEISPNPVPTFILKRGSAANPGEQVHPAFPQVLSPPKMIVPA